MIGWVKGKFWGGKGVGGRDSRNMGRGRWCGIWKVRGIWL